MKLLTKAIEKQLAKYPIYSQDGKGGKAAIKIAMNTNGISREIAEKYTDSELKECLRLLKLKTNF